LINLIPINVGKSFGNTSEGLINET